METVMKTLEEEQDHQLILRSLPQVRKDGEPR